MANFDLSQYEDVATRLEKFWKDHPEGAILTDMVFNDGKRVVFRADVQRTVGLTTATGYAQEIVGDGYINKTSAVENSETSSIGRALANMGYASKKKPRASREEMEKVERMTAQVDDIPFVATTPPPFAEKFTKEYPATPEEAEGVAMVAAPTPQRTLTNDYNGLSTRAAKVYMSAWPMGKHKGKMFKELPDDYLTWVTTKMSDDDPKFKASNDAKREAARFEQARRKEAPAQTSGVDGLAARLDATELAAADVF